jgi:hydroxyacylglutathione hydrolase
MEIPIKNNPPRVQGQDTEVFLIPVGADNYVFAARALGNDGYFAVDPGEPLALFAFLEQQSASLDGLLLTHEHSDHIGGVEQVLRRFPDCKIFGPPSVQTFLPELRDRFQDSGKGKLKLAGVELVVHQWPGHTVDQVRQSDQRHLSATLFQPAIHQAAARINEDFLRP